jgi:hypothetical protein
MRYIAVRGARSQKELLAYKYERNSVVGPPVYLPNDRVGAVIECPTDDAAQYQADRYASGMIGATLHDTALEAGKSLQ